MRNICIKFVRKYVNASWGYDKSNSVHQSQFANALAKLKLYFIKHTKNWKMVRKVRAQYTWHTVVRYYWYIGVNVV